MISSVWLALLPAAYAAGFLQARNINTKDRNFWLQAGKTTAERWNDTYSSAQFVQEGINRYGNRFIRLLDHLEVGGFSDGVHSDKPKS